MGKALAEWRAEILRDLGRDVSAQCRAVLDVAVTTKLLLNSIDNWLLQQPSLINGRRRCLFPVVLQRQQLADSLLRHLSALGLEKRMKQVCDLKDYLRERAAQGNRSERERPPTLRSAMIFPISEGWTGLPSGESFPSERWQRLP